MTKSVNDEKKTRVIKETNREDFLGVVNSIREMLNDSEFDNAICEKTANGLFKLSITRPNDMTGVKSFEASGLKWYQVPTTDYSVSFGSYIKYRLTAESKARSNAIKQLNELSTEEILALVASMKK